MVEYYPKILREYLDEKREGCYGLVDETTKHAAFIAGTSQSTSAAAKGPEPYSRKERSSYNEAVRPLEEEALLSFVKQEGLWISETDFKNKYENLKIGEGAEQKVYLGKNGKTVIKVNSGIFHGSWLEYFNRLIYHSFLFPSAKYNTIGFTIENKMFAVITEQFFFVLDKGAPREKVESYLNQHGFVRTKNDDYYNSEIGIILEDLHDENVFMDEHKILIFIDPVIYLETLDLGLSGKAVFRFPFGT